MPNLWGVLWRSKNRIDGGREHLMYRDCLPVLFQQRWEARNWIQENYGYLKTRKDLLSEPHGWKMPIPVKVKLIKQE